MGLFDNIRCEYPLAGLDDPTKIRFQTKDFPDPYMENYVITESGRLLHEEVRYEDRSDPTADNLLDQIAGCMTPVPIGLKDMHWHGWLHFYGDEHTGELMSINLRTGEDALHPGEPPEWFEYKAKFTDGNLVEVTRVA